jgi:hypothetical protein
MSWYKWIVDGELWLRNGGEGVVPVSELSDVAEILAIACALSPGLQLQLLAPIGAPLLN